MPDALLTTRQVADTLGIRPRQVQRLAERGDLRIAQRLNVGANGALLFDPVEVRAYAARQQQPAA